jgi:hypothetical protein
MKKTKQKIDVDYLLKEFASSAESQGFKINTLEDGRIYAHRNGGLKKCYISTGIHGDEPAGPVTMLYMMKTKMYPTNMDMLLFPCLNPEGFRKVTRSNNGMDLNRDYSSEKSDKTIFHKRALEKFGVPDMSILIHEDWSSDGFYMYDQCDSNSQSQNIINKVSQYFPINTHRKIDRHKTSSPGIITPMRQHFDRKKWPEAIWLWEEGCPQNYTLETPTEFPIKSRVKVLTSAVKQLIESL